MPHDMVHKACIFRTASHITKNHGRKSSRCGRTNQVPQIIQRVLITEVSPLQFQSFEVSIEERIFFDLSHALFVLLFFLSCSYLELGFATCSRHRYTGNHFTKTPFVENMEDEDRGYQENRKWSLFRCIHIKEQKGCPIAITSGKYLWNIPGPQKWRTPAAIWKANPSCTLLRLLAFPRKAPLP